MLCLCLLYTPASSMISSVSKKRTRTSLRFAYDREGIVLDANQNQPKLSASKTGSTSIITLRSPSFQKPLLPPWIPGSNNDNEDLTRAHAMNNLHMLNQALERHARFNIPLGSFSREDIDTVMDAVFSASKNDLRLIQGTADFLILLLSIEEYNSDSLDEDDDDEDVYYGDEVYPQFHAVMTRDALVASAFHYTDCVIAREAGIYDLIDNLMRTTKTSPREERTVPFGMLKTEVDLRNRKDLSRITRPSDSKDGLSGIALDFAIDEYSKEPYQEQNVERPLDEDEALTTRRERQNVQNGRSGLPSIEDYGSEATKISKSAARVKQAEIMSHAVLPTTITKVTPSPADAASLRGLLLSTSEDWRALAIRSTACLYRLRGLAYHERASSSFHGLSSEGGSFENFSNSQVVREAREALYVYAPLAERLGMHRLKGKLENAAFRVLYRRQYNTAKAVYAKSGAAIQSVTDYLTDNIEIVLKEDPWLAPQLERLTVTSRVKKPYSLWKKLLKVKSKAEAGLNSSALSVINPDALSITSVLDAIAMRVIIKAKKAHNEDNEHVRSREEFLCYYIQNRLMQMWPVQDSNRVKDYISTPKANGYQSLHHTSQCYRYGCFWPFEVQIRTEDMHTKSEFGVAAHWDYKLKGGTRGQEGGSLPKLEPASDVQKKGSPVLVVERDDENSGSNLADFSVTDFSELQFLKEGEGSIRSLSRSSMLKSSIDALSTARSHLLDNSVFVFYLTSDSAMEGKVIGLPIGSSVADALIEICKRCNLTIPKSFYASSFDVFLNGSIANLHDVVQTGDAIIVPALGERVQKYLSL